MVDWLFKKYPRTKRTCDFCNGSFGLARPNMPFCSAACKEKYRQALFRPPDQYELPLDKPPDELVKLLQYP